jgi:hypothetical protein
MCCDHCPAETAFPRTEFHEASASLSEPLRRAKNPTAVAEEEIKEFQVATATDRPRIRRIEVIQKFGLEGAVHE